MGLPFWAFVHWGGLVFLPVVQMEWVVLGKQQIRKKADEICLHFEGPMGNADILSSPMGRALGFGSQVRFPSATEPDAWSGRPERGPCARPGGFGKEGITGKGRDMKGI